jgi:hypothetical protein
MRPLACASGPRPIRLLIALAVVEAVVGSVVWHEPLRDAVTAARDFWARDDVEAAPFTAWRAALGLAGRWRQQSPGTRLAALLGAALRGIGALRDTPVAVAGAVALALVWMVPYLAIGLALRGATAAVALHLLPLGPVAIRACRRRRAPVAPGPGCAGRGAVALASRPTMPRRPGLAVAATMGAEHRALAGRLDPYTRTGFVPGEPFVRCEGGCGRAYKLVTWTLLDGQCPLDGGALAPGQAWPASAVMTADPSQPGGHT